MNNREAFAEDNSGLRPPASAEQSPSEPPRIYIASLSDYNEGRLHGEWLDAGQDLDQLSLAIDAMLQRSEVPGAEEYAIHDYSGFGPHISLSEYESVASVNSLARGIAAHGEAFAAWWATAENPADGEAPPEERFETAYAGTWTSVAAYAEDLLANLGAEAVVEGFPEWIRPYVHIDVAGFARDLVAGGDIVALEANDGVHVFDGTAP